MEGAGEGEGTYSLAKDRSRRSRKENKGTATLAALRDARQKGEKLKAKVNENEENIYDEVDEDEYESMVKKRQDDDWIVDDNGCGYVDDGREIFDDDLHEVSSGSKRGSKGKKGGAPGRKEGAEKGGEGQARSIKAMFAASAVRAKPKKEKDVSIRNDTALDDILGELSEQTEEAAVGEEDKALPPTSAKRSSADLFANPAPQLYRRQQGRNTSRPSAPTPPAKRPAAATYMQSASTKRGRVAEGRLERVLEHPVIEECQSLDVEMEEDMSSLPNVMDPDSDDGLGMDMSVIAESQETDSGPIESQDIVESSQDSAAIGRSVGRRGDPSSGARRLQKQKTMSFGEDIDEDLVLAADGFEAKNVPKIVPKPVAPAPTKIKVTTDWLGDSTSDLQTPKQEVVDCSKLPLVEKEDGSKVMRFYWLDAYEDSFRNTGLVYLFGKVYVKDSPVSCCILVRNINRRLFLLPRDKKYNLKSKTSTDEPVTLTDVYKEFDANVAAPYKMPNYKSKESTKKYAFDFPGVPSEAKYLEVQYSPDYPAVSKGLHGETFSHTFGSNTSSLERLLVDRRIKGPCWLEITNPRPSKNPVSWCKLEAEVEDMRDVSVFRTDNKVLLAPPPLVTVTLSIRTLPNAKTNQNEIVSIACLVNSGFHVDKPAPKKQMYHNHFLMVTHPSDLVLPFDLRDKLKKQGRQLHAEVFGTEKALLSSFLAKLHNADPDVLIGHDLFGFDLEVLLHRITKNNVPKWSRLGRLNRVKMPKFGGHFVDRTITSGRLVCDVKISAKELIRCKSYELGHLTSQMLDITRQELSHEVVRKQFGDSESLLSVLHLTMQDAYLCLRLVYQMNVLPLVWQITTICGNTLSRTLLGGKSERNEFLLLHAFNEKNYIVPDKEFGKKTKPQVTAEDDDDVGQVKGGAKRKAGYAGGLVLEPQKGFYDTFILCLDFNSLYPSIIQEFNICFTTVDHRAAASSLDEDAIPDVPSTDITKGILPDEIRKLVESRKQVKSMMKDKNITTDQYTQHDIRQKALKITANSIYGCLGFVYSRFYARSLAALVTSKGREILMSTKALVQTSGHNVIYGDTDSIMVNTMSHDYDEVMKIGNKMCLDINKLYGLIDIGIDNVFKSMLLLKKKKYAALDVKRNADGTFTESEEMKGLDIVRRDWCQLAKDTGTYVVKQLLSGCLRSDILENIQCKLTEVGDSVRAGEVDRSVYVITKQLTKNPSDYPDKKSLPHVQVAMRLNSGLGKKLRGGDTVDYIICLDGTSQSHTQRAYHPDEIDANDNLKIDFPYYLGHQVHPVVSRLMEPIDGTDPEFIAGCLGLDTSGYRQRYTVTDEEGSLSTLLSDQERFKRCERLMLKCAECSTENSIEGVFHGEGESLRYRMDVCENPECTGSLRVQLPVNRTKKRLTTLARTHARRYYDATLRCDDSACAHTTRSLSMRFRGPRMACRVCRRGVLLSQYTDKMLYTQLCFYESVFDVDRAKTQLKPQDRSAAARLDQEGLDFCESLRHHVKKILNESAFSSIDIGALFSQIHA